VGHACRLHLVHGAKHQCFAESPAAMIGMGAALLAPQVPVKITDEP